MSCVEAEESSTISPPVGEAILQGDPPSLGPSDVMSEEYPLPNFSADGCFRSGREEGGDNRDCGASTETDVVLGPALRAPPIC